MKRRRQRPLHGIAAPVFSGEPLVIRFCRSFVDNLSMLLRGAFILGALLLVQEFDGLAERISPLPADAEPVPQAPVVVHEPELPAEPEQPVLTDRVRHYLNCTYAEYRRDHYAECVEEPSGIYRAPEANPDDTGSLLRPSPLRFAYRFDPAAMPGPAAKCDDPLACSLLL